MNEIRLEESTMSAKLESNDGTPLASPNDKLSTKVHPQHWCGQHKFEADSPTNFYDYTTSKNKNKSAMCRVAEIARFNKLRHFYDLQDESGPAHKKLFTVRLVLNNEETFEGSGTSIKRAQQAAAETALEKTSLPQPSERNARRRLNEMSKPHRVLQNVCRTLSYVSPNYVSCNPPVFPDPQCIVPEHILLPEHEYSMYQPQFPLMPLDPNRPLGPTLQAVIFYFVFLYCEKVIVYVDGKPLATGVAETFPLAKQDARQKLSRFSDRRFENTNYTQKSVISDIHEKAHLLKLNVVFETLKEEGPPHDRVYVVRCAFVSSNKEVKAEAIGKGKKKKVAQQEACTQLLKNAEHLSPQTNPVSVATNVCRTQKKLASIHREPKRKTIVKDKKMDPHYGHQINPVSRLIQVTQAKSRHHPTFELLSENGVSKYKEFVIQAKYGEIVCEGKGPNKRLAKRAAAEEMLDLIGFVKPLPPPGKSLLKKNPDADYSHTQITHWTGPPSPKGVEEIPSFPTPSDIQTKISIETGLEEKSDGSPDTEKRRVTFNSEVYACPPPGDQNYPNSIVQSLKKDTIVEGKFRKLKRSKEHRRVLTADQMQELSDKAELFLDSAKQGFSADPFDTAHHQLDRLSQCFKFSVHYTAFPQTEMNQEFTIVSLGLDTPLVGHGTGDTTEEADERAALDAITKLKQLASISLQP
ncbi:Protein CBG08071 [Caenorhabditis briggsae]|uniref:Protein CBG08071 n=1 Tax=Caenorhabditis briggsae TaxID=6238 RepID=A8X5Q8_CAEBR|nr:Protein CBG08071 [Caenorhabditis briggsae]CAP27969.2 Protein CBG08071 [Caenorhabditis briggsae]